MANLAWTQYVVEGPKKTLEEIKHAIKNPDIEEGSSKDWEGNVLRALNIEWERQKPDGTGKRMRGFIQQSWWDNKKHTVLRLDAEEAWSVTDFSEVLEDNFPDIKVYWYCEEPSDAYYVTNDVEGKYFKDKYYVDACIKNNYYTEYFIEEKDLWHWISIWSNGKVTSQKELDEFNDSVDENFKDYIDIHPIKIVK